MSKRLARLVADRRAATAVEYALIAALLVLGAAIWIGLLGATMEAMYLAIEQRMGPQP
jgi:Flp pilus assembly pilin Flp